MNILKNKMQRRDFLRTLAKAGLTTAFASQFMLSKNVFAASGGAKRFIMMYYPNGCVFGDGKWHGYSDGALGSNGLDNSSPLKPLTGHIDKILPIRNLNLDRSGGNTSHYHSTKIFSGGNGGATFDATMSQNINTNSQTHLYTSLWARENRGIIEGSPHLPFVDKNGGIVGENDDPQTVYDNRIGPNVEGGNNDDPEVIRRKRVLESLHENLDLLQNKELNITQQNKLLGHEEGLDFYQTILANNINVGDPTSYSRPTVAMPIVNSQDKKDGSNYTNEQHALGEDIAKAQMRNIAMAFQAGLTNTASFQFMAAQDESLMINFPSIRPFMGEYGSGEKLYWDHTKSHVTSHNASDLFNSQTIWYNMMVAYLMDQLAARPDAAYGGTLLDNTLILMMSEVGQGSNHDPKNAGIYLAGGAGGAIRTGNAINANNADISDLFFDISKAFGLNWNGYGASNGTSTGILV